MDSTSVKQEQMTDSRKHVYRKGQWWQQTVSICVDVAEVMAAKDSRGIHKCNNGHGRWQSVNESIKVANDKFKNK